MTQPTTTMITNSTFHNSSKDDKTILRSPLLTRSPSQCQSPLPTRSLSHCHSLVRTAIRPRRRALRGTRGSSSWPSSATSRSTSTAPSCRAGTAPRWPSGCCPTSSSSSSSAPSAASRSRRPGRRRATNRASGSAMSLALCLLVLHSWKVLMTWLMFAAIFLGFYLLLNI